MKNLRNKLTSIAGLFFSTMLFVSCQKEALVPTTIEDYNASTTNIAPYSSMNTTSASTLPATTTAPAFNLSLNWNNYPNGLYTYQNAVTDFKNVIFWEGQSRTKIYGSKMYATLLKNSLAGQGGVIANMDVPDASEYQMTFDMMFDQNFDFSWGGKVGFGFMIGNGYSGGANATDGNGASIRLMWNKTTSAGRTFLKPYMYHKDQPGTWGDDKGKSFPATGSIAKGVWYKVQMYVKSNTGSNSNGHVRILINGVTLIDQPMRWTTNDSKRLINKISFETFRGGAETYWQSPTDGYIYFDNLNVQALAN